MPRANFTNFRSAMEQHNALIADFCLNNDVPEEHFIKQDLTVHPVVVSASRKVIILQREMFKFLDELVTCFRFSDSGYSTAWRYAAANKLTLRYPVIWNADKTGVITFPNLLLDNCNRRTVTDMVNENPWIPVHTASVTETIKADLAHPERRAAWTPMSRGIKRLGKRQELSMSRALARAVLWDGKPIENAQTVENIAQKMLDIHKPADFYFADTVDEIRAMYRRESDETPHSCMDSRHRFNLEGDVRPVDFYAHCPNSRGAYIAKGNIVLARTILWRGQDDKWCYSRIYAGRAAHRETLIEHLENAGVEDIETAHCRVNCSFSIPLGYFNGDKAMPVPYIDSRPFSTVQVKVLDDTHFLVSMGGKRKDSKDGWQFPSLQSTTGAFFPTEYHGCENCGSEINMDDDCFVRVNSDIYCSHDCATDYDAIRICTSDSHEYVYDRDVPDGVVFNGFNVDYVFSNRQAAINRGSLYRVVPWAETEEPMFLEPAFHDVRHVVWTMVEFDAKTSARMSIYSPRQAWADCHNDIWPSQGDNAWACVAIECEGTFNPQMANVLGQCDIAYNVNESDFTDAMFDEFVGDVANTPAPYVDGVLINETIQTR